MADTHVLFALRRKYAERLGTNDAEAYLKAEMTRAGVRNAELAKRLTDMGLPEAEAGVQVKINRGAFPAWFLMAALSAIGCTTLRLD